MNFISQVVHWVTNVYQPFPEPALHGMRLGPENTLDNPLMFQFFTWDCKHETLSWWKHLEYEIPRLARMGITQIWLPPPNKAMHGDGRGYDAYDLWDLGEFYQKGSVATRWGSKDELLRACAVARQHRIDILIDAVLNHKLGGDRLETFHAVTVDPENRLKEVGEAKEIDGWTAFDFPGRSGKYSSLRWTYKHFSGLDWDHRTRTSGIYKIVSEKHKGWSQRVNKERGNYDYLLGMDIDHRHPEVREDLFSWGTWVLDTTGATGFRLDAIKHIDREFLSEFIKTVRHRSGRTRMFAVAEYWSADLDMVLPYIRAFRGQTAFFDVPLHDNFHQASKQGSDYDLRTVLDNTVLKTRPGDAVTFVDNHDTVIGQSLESWVDKGFKLQAYALILLRGEGHPCIFYGDLYPNREGYDEKISQNLKLLIEARKLFAYGPTKDYFKDRNCISFVRQGDVHHPGCAVVISNGYIADSSTHSARMNLGVENGGTIFRNHLPPHDQVKIAGDGWQIFPRVPHGVQVWVRSDEQ